MNQKHLKAGALHQIIHKKLQDSSDIDGNIKVEDIEECLLFARIPKKKYLEIIKELEELELIERVNRYVFKIKK